MLEAEGYSIGGMINQPIIDGRRRVGFYTKDWKTKERSTFAHVDFESKVMVGKLGVDLAKMEEVGVQAILGACDSCDVIVVDEVGRMEVESKAFVDAVKHAMDVDKPMILTLHKKSRNPLLQDIRRRDDVRILEVTPTNRNLLPYKIMNLMSGETV